MTTRDRETTTNRGTLLVILSCDFLITLDFFIVNVAVPSMKDDLSAGAAAIQLVIAGYALAYACGLITWGRLGDIHGRRRMFFLGTALFTLASAACGLAPTAGTLIAARVVQGIAAAVMAPQMLAILGTVYTGAARARAFGVAMLGKGMAAVFGQLVGGALIQLNVGGLGWRLCFLINVPVGIVVLTLMRRLVPESRAGGRTGLDLPGAALVTGGLVLVILPLVEGHQRSWPWWSWVSLTASAALAWAFVARQRRLTATGGAPLVSTTLFHDRTFSAGAIMITLYYAGMGAFFLVLALYLQHGSGLGALDAGLISTAIGLGFFAVTMGAAALTRRLGRQMIALGGLLLATGWALLAITVSAFGPVSAGWLVPALFVCGTGMGLIMAPLTATTIANVSTRHVGAASGVLNTAIQVGSALGVALVGIVLDGARGAGGAAGAADGLARSAVYLVGVAVIVAALSQLLEGPRNDKDVRGGPAAAPADHAVAGGH